MVEKIIQLVTVSLCLALLMLLFSVLTAEVLRYRRSAGVVS